MFLWSNQGASAASGRLFPLTQFPVGARAGRLSLLSQGLPDGPGVSVQLLPGPSEPLCVGAVASGDPQRGHWAVPACHTRGKRGCSSPPLGGLAHGQGMCSWSSSLQAVREKQTLSGCSAFSERPLIKLDLIINLRDLISYFHVLF